MSENPYPAVRKLLRTFFGKRRPTMFDLDRTYATLAATHHAIDYAECGADLGALLASAATDTELEHVLFTTLGCRYDPRLRRETVRDWLENLKRFAEEQAKTDAWLAGLEQPLDARATRLRPLVATEVERIGAAELAERTRLEPAALHAFLAGEILPKAALDTFDHYSFGPYPDLRHLMQSFHQDYDIDFGSQAWEPVVDDYIRLNTPGQVRGTAADLGRLLKATHSELELGGILQELHCCFPVEWAGWTHREWLLAVRDRLARQG